MHKYNLLRKIIVSALLGCAVNLSGEDKKLSGEVNQLLLERARNGEAQAQLEAGFAFYRSNNPVRAAYWFHQASQQGSAPAQYNMGRCYAAGYGVKKDLHRAFEYFRQAAAEDLAPAQLEAAKLYLSGIAAVPEAAPPLPAIEPDEKAALALLDKLAVKQYSPALLLYANYLIRKFSATKQRKIIALLEMAIGSGDKTAPVVLADFLLSRTDEFRDEKRARMLLENSASENPEAMAKLAFAVENGFGAPPDPEKAFILYRESLQKAFIPLAATRLANYYYSGRSGVTQDIPQAIKLYTRAAAAGIPEAVTQLGLCCKNGIGMPIDKEKAFELLFQAAKMDYPAAQYELAECFAAGEGTVADQRGAFFWFNQAAMRYDPRALLEVGKRYLYGNGTAPDASKAVAYLEQAYANGMNEAMSLLNTARKQAQADNTVKPHPLPRFGL